MTQDPFEILLEKWLTHSITEPERDKLFALLRDPAYRSRLDAIMEEQYRQGAFETEEDPRMRELIFERIKDLREKETPVITLSPRKKLPYAGRWVAAAIIILVFGAGTLWWFMKQPLRPGNTEQNALVQKDILPGGNKAILTLGNGSQIILDSATNGTLAQQGNTKILKLDSGKLAYSMVNEKPTAILYNTLSTPRGGQYQLMLPDGSMVWLNAASSIKYPVAFSGNERMVEITGEAYFEVVHDARMPFKVKAGKEIIEDLGTHFNINAYDDEPVLKTTLLEGSIKIQSADVNSGNGSKQGVILKPGQQAQIANVSSRQIKVINDVNIEAVVAWKNGQFHLKGMDMGALMRQVARWYDVDVEFEGRVPEKKFGGSISRNVNLSAVLEALHDNGVQCSLEGNKIKVMP